jgi:hypothetical protein
MKDESQAVADAATELSADERRRMIAELAYYRAERRGFAHGDAVADWLEAEQEVLQRIDEAPGKGSKRRVAKRTRR